jgi:hypothetical protein
MHLKGSPPCIQDKFFSPLTIHSGDFNSYSGLAVCYAGDWNFIITGVNSDSEDGVWDAVFGDGYQRNVGVWSDCYEVIKREASEAYQYTAPFIAYPDVFRVFRAAFPPLGLQRFVLGRDRFEAS